MLVRVIVGLIAALFAIGLLVLIGYGHCAYVGIAVAVFSAICMHEIMGTSKCKNKVLTGITMAFSAFESIYIYFDLGRYIPVSNITLIAIYMIGVLMLMLKFYENTKFENTAIGLLCSIAIPESLGCIYRIYNVMNDSNLFCTSQIIYVILMSMFSAWLCDTFSLFSGMAFGKHKLSPKISPKKTIEGAVGGVLATTVFGVIAWFICNHFFFHQDVAGNLKLWYIIVLMPIICIIGICGDLTASVLKRNFGVKDFGTMFPGHGGAMDRIDSFLFAVPATAIIVDILVAIAK